MVKKTALVPIFLLILLSLAAAEDYPINILRVEVNDVDNALGGPDTPLYAERGETLNILVVARSNESLDDTTVSVKISGYEHGSLDVESGLFDMEAGDIHSVPLELTLPSDMDVDTKYNLKIEVSNPIESSSFETSLRIRPERHKLRITEVLVSPKLSVESGERLFVNVWVENVGAKKEENIEARAAIPKLGVSAVRVIDDLVPHEDESDATEDSSETGTMMMEIPAQAPTGDYELIIDVYYNDDYSKVTEKKIVHVENTGAVEVDSKENEIISIASNIPDLKAGGKEIAFRMSITNLVDKEKSYSIQILGTQLWADAWIEPAFVTVQPGETKGISGFLKAFEEAEEGSKVFTVKISSGDNVIEERNLNVDITNSQAVQSEGIADSILNTDLLTGMAIGKKGSTTTSPLSSKLKTSFAIIIGLMVATGVYLGYRKIREDDLPLEPKRIYY